MTCCKQFTRNYDLRPLICNTFVLEIATLVSMKKKCPLYLVCYVETIVDSGRVLADELRCFNLLALKRSGT